MTAPVEVEITELSDADLDGAPPCEMYRQWRWSRRGGRLCGKPSTHRVRVTCPLHGTRLRFLCPRHLLVTRLGRVGCRTCERECTRHPVRFLGIS